MAIQGMTVKLINLIDSGETDPFGCAIYTETETNVDNVLVGNPTAQEVLDMNSLYGKKAVFSLGIPKGDTHVWKDQYVEFFGRRWHVFNDVIMGIEANVPGPWHHMYYVEHYE